MLRKLMPRSVYDVMAAIACFGVLAGGTAYAANTVFSSDIVDGEVKAPDIGANAVDSARVRDNTINTFDVHSFLGADVVNGTLTGADVGDDTLTTADIVESSLGQVPSAADSDKLDGIDSTGFVQGSGRILRFYRSGANEVLNLPTPLGLFAIGCPDGAVTEVWGNNSDGPVSLWSHRVGATQPLSFQTVPRHTEVTIFSSGAATTERVTVHVSNGTLSETFDAWIEFDGATCTFSVAYTSDD